MDNVEKDWVDEFQSMVMTIHTCKEIYSALCEFLYEVKTPSQRRQYLNLLYLFYHIYGPEYQELNISVIFDETDTWEDEWLDIIHNNEIIKYVGNNPILIAASQLVK